MKDRREHRDDVELEPHSIRTEVCMRMDNCPLLPHHRSGFLSAGEPDVPNHQREGRSGVESRARVIRQSTRQVRLSVLCIFLAWETL